MTTAPLFRDPIYDGAADPTVIWNRQEKAWWILYTNRRASLRTRGVAWVHGTDIGIASSTDGGASWRYRGILPNLEFEPGRNTFWAPEVLWNNDRYHMYISYVVGIPHDWSGERRIVHMTSLDLWNWKLETVLNLSSNHVIDACVHPLANGIWRMWYKDEANGSYTYAADSADLYHWTVAGPVITDCAHEGPNVFTWRGSYWMVTDPWRGLGVYRSSDGIQWTRQANILEVPGRRPDDAAFGKHADVLVQGDQAFIFYFTHPVPGSEKYSYEDTWPYEMCKSSLQVAGLDLHNDQLVCDRDHDFDLNLKPLS
jgi:hypothetical protein